MRYALSTFLLLLAACGGGTGSNAPSSAPGDLVPTFGAGGVVDSNPSPLGDFVRAMATNATHMFVVGSDSAQGAADQQWRIEKRSLADGSLDPAFGTDGVVQVNPSGGTDMILAIALDESDLYVGGWDRTPGDFQWRVEKRSQGDGSLVAGFGVGGVMTTNPTAGGDSLTALLVVGSGLYLAGNDGNNILIEKRSKQDGALDPLFGVAGVVTSNPSPAYDTASELTTDGMSLFIAGRDQSLGGGTWSVRVEKRSLSDGALVAGFGVGGVVSASASPTYDAAYAVVHDGGWIYLAGTDEGPGAGDRQFRVEKRSAVDGAPDPTFGVAGAVTLDFGIDDEEFTCLVVDGEFLYVAGSDEAPGNGRWHIQKRRTSDGGLDDAFGSGGMVIDDPSPDYDVVSGLAVDGTTLYAAGTAFGGEWRIEKRLK